MLTFFEIAASTANKMNSFTYVMIVFLSDVNECADPLLNDCTQTCTNTVGGYTCGCREGFTKYNATFCKGIYVFVNTVYGSYGSNYNSNILLPTHNEYIIERIIIVRVICKYKRMPRNETLEENPCTGLSPKLALENNAYICNLYWD